MEAIDKLPEEVIHLVLSFLGAEDAAKTSVLSKLWLCAWLTQPILQCDENYFPCRKKFANYVNTSLLRYEEKKISIQKLKLIFDKDLGLYYDKNHEYKWKLFMRRWIERAMKNGLKKLELENVPKGYSLPPIVFKVLDELSLCNGSIRRRHVPVKISCIRLKTLSFSRIYFNEEGALEKILSICQCIEVLNLCEVYYQVGKLKMLVQNLKEIHILSCVFNKLEIEAPNLEVFTCSNCPKLRDLKVTSQISLRNLHVNGSSDSELQYLSVDSLNTMAQFDYYSRINFIPTVSFTNLSTRSVSNIHLDVMDSRQFWELKKLLRILMPSRISLSMNRIIDATTFSETDCFRFEEGHKLPIPVRELSLGQPSSAFRLTGIGSEFHTFLSLDFSAVIDAIFWTCRPTSIKLSTSPSKLGTSPSGYYYSHNENEFTQLPPWYYCSANEFTHYCSDNDNEFTQWYYCSANEFTQFLVWKLMVQRQWNYYDSKEIKCWQRDLREVKVDFRTKNDQGEWKPESWDWETFLNMISKAQVLISVTCDWERSSYAQEA